MKFSLAILAAALIVASFASVGCGEESRATEEGSEELQAKTREYLAAPTVDLPEGPPPKKVVVKNLKQGSGAVATRGDQVAVHFRGFYYRTGKEYCFEWRPSPPVTYRQLGDESGEIGLQRGIEGMREGGRREVTVPSHLNSAEDPLIYVVELVSVNSAASPSGSA